MIPPRVKICGITNLPDALMAAQEGAWALGFIFVAKSPRYLDAASAAKIIIALPANGPLPVGVFADASEDEIIAIVDASGVRAIQLHGREERALAARLKARRPQMRIFRAFGVADAADIKDLHLEEGEDFALLDTRVGGRLGGTGLSFDWNLAVGLAPRLPMLLAGGLNPENVASAARLVRPFAVDVSSGVESQPGQKDSARMHAFFEAIRLEFESATI